MSTQSLGFKTTDTKSIFYNSDKDPFYSNVSLLISARSGTIADLSATPKTLSMANVVTDSVVTKYSPFSFKNTTASTAYIDVPHSADLVLNGLGSNTTFTIEAWVYNFAGTAGIILDKGNQSFSSVYNYSLGILTGGTVVFRWGNGLFSPQHFEDYYITVPNVVPTGQWHHIAVSCLRGLMTMYVNGVPYLTALLNTSHPDNGKSLVLFNRVSRDLSTTVNSTISEVRITKGISRYNKPFTVPAIDFPL